MIKIPQLFFLRIEFAFLLAVAHNFKSAVLAVKEHPLKGLQYWVLLCFSPFNVVVYYICEGYCHCEVNAYHLV